MKRYPIALTSASLGLLALAVVASYAMQADDAPKAIAQGDGLTISSDRLPNILEAASPGERPLLEDGVLTADEYRGAVEGSIGCIESAGFSIVHFADTTPGLFYEEVRLSSRQPGYRLNARGLIEYSAIGGPSPDVGTNSALVAGCKEQSALVERLWTEHLGPEPSSQAVLDWLAQCLRQSGEEVPEHPTMDELQEAVMEPVPGLPEGIRMPSEAYKECERERAQQR